ncbi:hypothetical protein V6N11_025530 [Hibiscus sabdariffa]|uniref:Uncharacterized protein n=2 Tax=Hibiscus sabdariffa TaxID=183260 RepID=A0ABR2AZ56_9ROSI
MGGSGGGRVKRDFININYTQVSDLIHAPSATWRVDVLQALFDEEQVDTICSIPLSKSRKCDEIIWPPDGSGIYSVKSGYKLLRDDLSVIAGVTGSPYSSMVLRFFNEMWSVNLPAKVKINMWKVANSFLPTYSALQNRSLHVNNVCPFCRYSGETVAHIMRDCSFVCHLFVAQGIYFPSCLMYPNWLDWVAVAFCSLNTTNKVVMMVTFWAVWYARNKLVHERTAATVHGTLSFISAFIGVNDVVHIPPSTRRLDDAGVWKAPELNVIKFNFDATYDFLSKKSVPGIIGNIVAHTLARVGRGHQVPSYWIEEAPPEVTAAAMVDLERLASS